MKRRKRKSQAPNFILWSKWDQKRFVDTVEKLTAVVNDLVHANVQLQASITLLQAKVARKQRKPRPEPAAVGALEDVDGDLAEMGG